MVEDRDGRGTWLEDRWRSRAWWEARVRGIRGLRRGGREKEMSFVVASIVSLAARNMLVQPSREACLLLTTLFSPATFPSPFSSFSSSNTQCLSSFPRCLSRLVPRDVACTSTSLRARTSCAPVHVLTHVFSSARSFACLCTLLHVLRVVWWSPAPLFSPRCGRALRSPWPLGSACLMVSGHFSTWACVC